MNDSAEAGFIRQRAAGEPMLLECDSLGRVLWMSERTGIFLHNPSNLLDALCLSAMPDQVPATRALQFWLVLKFRNSVVIGAQIVDQAGCAPLARLV